GGAPPLAIAVRVRGADLSRDGHQCDHGRQFVEPTTDGDCMHFLRDLLTRTHRFGGMGSETHCSNLPFAFTNEAALRCASASPRTLSMSSGGPQLSVLHSLWPITWAAGCPTFPTIVAAHRTHTGYCTSR